MFPSALKCKEFPSVLLLSNPYRMCDEHTHAVSQDLTLFNSFSTLHYIHYQVHTIFGRCYTQICPWNSLGLGEQFHANNILYALKILWKAITLIMSLFSSASVNTVQLQPSRWMLLLQHVHFCFLAPAYFLAFLCLFHSFTSGLVARSHLHIRVFSTVSNVKAGVRANVRYGSLLKVE